MSMKSFRGWAAALLIGGGLLALACNQEPSGSVTPAAPTSGLGKVSVSLLPASSSFDGTPGGLGGQHHLRDSDIAQLFLTFGTIRLYPVPDSLPGHGHHDGGPGHGPMPPDPLPGHGHHGDGPGHGPMPPDPLPGHGHHGGGPGHGPMPPDSLPPAPPCPRDSAAFIEILTSPLTVDVMQLADTLGTILTSANVPAGRYSHLALRISNASAVTDSGQTVAVSVASPDSLLRVLSSFTVVEGQSIDIQIHIDLDRSVREVPPGSGNYVLMPVLSGEMHRRGGGGHCGPGGGHGHGGPRGR